MLLFTDINARNGRAGSNTFQFWKFGTINVQSAKDDWRLENAIRHVANAKLSFCAFQEVRRPTGNTIISYKSARYEVHWSGYPTKSQAGVGIAIKIDPHISKTQYAMSQMQNCLFVHYRRSDVPQEIQFFHTIPSATKFIGQAMPPKVKPVSALLLKFHRTLILSQLNISARVSSQPH